MNKPTLHFTSILTTLVALGLLAASACAHEGPMERAGRHVDNTASDVKHDVKKAAKDD